MHAEAGGVEGDGRQNEPDSVPLARSYDFLLLKACDWTTRQQ